MNQCKHCNGPLTRVGTQIHNDKLYCTAKCQRAAHREAEEGRLDAKRPTGPTTMAHIDAALERARAQQRAS